MEKSSGGSLDALLTTHLHLIPLDLTDLQVLLSHPARISAAPELSLSSKLVTSQIELAIEAKIIKIQSAGPALYLWYTYWLIAISEEGIGAGMVGFKGKPDAEGAVEFGYGMDERYQNRGFMTEAVQAMIRWAFSHPLCRRISAQTLRTNLPSQRVLFKSGFKIYKETHAAFDWKLDRPAQPTS